MIEKNTTQADDTVALLVQQFKEKPNIEGVLRALAEQVQSLENAYDALLNERDLDSAVGAQLDIIGVLVGRPRNGMSDDVYRLFLRAQILINKSRGTPEDVIEVASVLFVGAGFTYTEHHPYPEGTFTLDDGPGLDDGYFPGATSSPAEFQLHISTPLVYAAEPDPFIAAGLILSAKPTAVRGVVSWQYTNAFAYDTGPGYDSGIYSGARGGSALVYGA